MSYGSMHCSHSNLPISNCSCKDTDEAVKTLMAAVDQLKATVTVLSAEVSALKVTIGDSSSGLVKRISDLENA